MNKSNCTTDHKKVAISPIGCSHNKHFDFHRSQRVSLSLSLSLRLSSPRSCTMREACFQRSRQISPHMRACPRTNVPSSQRQLQLHRENSHCQCVSEHITNTEEQKNTHTQHMITLRLALIDVRNITMIILRHSLCRVHINTTYN